MDSSSLSLSCDNSLGEATCGSICCASFQYCASAGQCVSSSDAAKSSRTASNSGTDDRGAGMTTSSTGSLSQISTTASVYTVTTSLSKDPNVQSPSIIVSTITNTQIPSTISTAMSAPTTSSALSPAKPVAHRAGSIVGITLGGAVALALVLLCFWCCRGRRHVRGFQSTGPSPEDPIPIPIQRAPYGRSHPPSPDPYRQNFPTGQPPLNANLSPSNRSQLDGTLTPDHAVGSSPQQASLRNSPALNPYHISSTALSSASSIGGQGTRSPAPSYQTEDPLGAPMPPFRQNPVRRPSPLREARS